MCNFIYKNLYTHFIYSYIVQQCTVNNIRNEDNYDRLYYIIYIFKGTSLQTGRVTQKYAKKNLLKPTLSCCQMLGKSNPNVWYLNKLCLGNW